MRQLLRKIIEIYQWLRASVQYSMFLWDNHYDYDYHFILDLLRFKLRRCKLEMQQSGFIEGNKRYARQIAYAEMLLELLLQNDLCSKEWAAHEEKYGELHFSFEKAASELKTYPMGAVYRDKVFTAKQYKAEREESMVIYDLENIRRQDAWDRLFKHLAKYMRGWWT